MTEGKIDELSRVLGGIERQLEMIARTQAEDRVASATYRTEIRKEVSDQRGEHANLSGEIKGLKDDVSEMKPIVGRLNDAQLMAIGAGKFAQFVSRGLYAILGALGAFILTWIERHWR